MSGSGGGKINPKNLLYDRSATLPPFLARLHAQHAPGNFDGPDPILAARRRPTKRPRSGSEEAEDAPLVLDEEGNVVETVSVGRDGTVRDKSTSRVEGEGEGEGDGAGDGTKEGVTIREGNEGKEGNGEKEGDQKEAKVGIGASKKRKVGKVIGGDDGSDHEKDGDDSKPNGKTKDKDSGTSEEAHGEKPKPKTAKKKKTAKKIKLSFGDEEG